MKVRFFRRRIVHIGTTSARNNLNRIFKEVAQKSSVGSTPPEALVRTPSRARARGRLVGRGAARVFAVWVLAPGAFQNGPW